MTQKRTHRRPPFLSHGLRHEISRAALQYFSPLIAVYRAFFAAINHSEASNQQREEDAVRRKEKEFA
jgi:hypothetical protein